MSQAMVVLVCACRGVDLANPVYCNSEVRHGADTSVYCEVINARLPGKAASHNL
jgi:glucose-6-phosphate dehydrogenase assembly protein OpcA